MDSNKNLEGALRMKIKKSEEINSKPQSSRSSKKSSHSVIETTPIADLQAEGDRNTPERAAATNSRRGGREKPRAFGSEP